MKKINLGIIAHVDSGKTTLTEALLYQSGTRRQFGRVDKGESFLDGDPLERKRGITIYSKLAQFTFGDTEFTMLDTPGHVDFSAETERTLQVLDYALLMISAADGISGQSETLWNLLEKYKIPTFIFFNKMDQPGADRTRLLNQFRAELSDSAVDFSGYVHRSAGEALDTFYDQVAMCDEAAMEEYLKSQSVCEETIQDMIAERKIFPCFFGSALKIDGIGNLIFGLDTLTLEREYPEEFGARVYKIMKGQDGSRLTFLKVTGGSLKNRDVLPDGGGEVKISQIRIYSGDRFSAVQEVSAGQICAVAGLSESFAGQGFGYESEEILPVLVPALRYRVVLAQGEDPALRIRDFRTLEEESPELSVSWDEKNAEIYVCVMGKVQLEILKSVLEERFGLAVSFDSGEVLYKETISAPVRGVGHFEPLRHYAEVHLLIEPLPEGSGVEICSNIRTDQLAVNWQRLIVTHLLEKQHLGVLTGSPVTDVRITAVAGKASVKHTSGGDFRQAVYRAVRQGLMMAESRLLEPYYRFSLQIPQEAVGRAMTDLDRMKAEFSAPDAADGMAVITGRVAVAAFGDYSAEIAAYTKGQGRVSFVPYGYGPCHNPEEVIAGKGYDPSADIRNTPDSVFCANGSGYIVTYDKVYEYMHIPFSEDSLDLDGQQTFHVNAAKAARTVSKAVLGTEDVDAILAGVSRKGEASAKPGWKRRSRNKGFGASDSAKIQDKIRYASQIAVFSPENAEYLLVDGYNVIFAWEDLADLAGANMDSARISLQEILCNWQALHGCEVIVVYDAYRVKGHDTEHSDYQNIHVVFTKEAETADQYIERFAHDHGKKDRVAVVTSDGMEQIIIRGQGCALISSREFERLVKR